jgi:hypothetical protein
VIAYDPFAATLARWLDTRLRAPGSSHDDDVDDPDRDDPDPVDPDPDDPDPVATTNPHVAARLFGLVVLDREGAASGDDGSVRFVAIAEGEAYELVRTVAPLAMHHHEALALVTEGWAAPLPPAGDEDGDLTLIRPSRHPARRRVRVTTVALETGAIGTALRWLGGDEGAVDPGPVAGPLAEALGQACGVTEATHRAGRTGEHDRSSAA